MKPSDYSLPVQTNQSEPIILEVNISFNPNLAQLEIKTKNNVYAHSDTKQNVKFTLKVPTNTAIRKIHAFVNQNKPKTKATIRTSTRQAQNPQNTYHGPPKNKIIQKTRTTIKKESTVVKISDNSFDQLDQKHNRNFDLLKQKIESGTIVPINLESDSEQFIKEQAQSDGTIVLINLESDSEQFNQLPDVLDSQDSQPEAKVAILKQESNFSSSNSKCRNLFPNQTKKFTKKTSKKLCKSQKPINSQNFVEKIKQTKIELLRNENSRINYENLSKSLKTFEATPRNQNQIAIYLKHYAGLSKILNSTTPLSQLIIGPILKGLIFQQIIIELIMKRDTCLKVNTYKKIDSEWKKTSIQMYFAGDKAYPFESLPKVNQNVQEYQFLRSFKKYDRQCIYQTVYLPVKRSIITNIKSHINHGQVDYTSQCIDFITSGYLNNNFLIVAWDVTISQFAVKKKLKKFWLAFNQFKDRFQKRLNENTQVSLEYIILMDKKSITKDFTIAKILRKVDPNLASHYTFEEHAATCIVSHYKGNCLLKKISILDYSELKIESKNQASAQALACYQKCVSEFLTKPDQSANAN